MRELVEEELRAGELRAGAECVSVAGTSGDRHDWVPADGWYMKPGGGVTGGGSGVQFAANCADVEKRIDAWTRWTPSNSEFPNHVKHELEHEPTPRRQGPNPTCIKKNKTQPRTYIQRFKPRSKAGQRASADDHP